MAGTAGSPNEVSLPTLMGAAQRTYVAAIQAALEAAGYGDIPPTGYRIVGALTRAGSGVQELAGRLAMSKQATGRLADVLVVRGYVARQTDPEDRRRVILTLTERGRAATDIARSAIGLVDRALAEVTAEEDVVVTRATLRALVSIGRLARVGAGSPAAWSS